MLRSEKMDAGDHFGSGQKREKIQSSSPRHTFEHGHPGTAPLTEAVEQKVLIKEVGSWRDFLLMSFRTWDSKDLTDITSKVNCSAFICAAPRRIQDAGNDHLKAD